ncbi:MAG: winged helix-turn-helix domain-containing protein [bacterium]
MPDLNWKEAIIAVLRQSDEPLHYTDIAEAIAAQGLREELGPTPARTVNGIISRSLRDDKAASPFVRVSRGHYSLREKELPQEEPTDEEELIEETGLIHAFGMYWWPDKVLWTSSPRLLGQQQQGSSPVDFCAQRGVYMLHDGRHVVYVGRASEQTLGARLRQHTVDRLNGRWDRFSWFGVFPVSEDATLSADAPQRFSVETLIATMEALLIEGLEPPQNRKRGDQFTAVEFLQVSDPDIQKEQTVRLIEKLKETL